MNKVIKVLEGIKALDWNGMAKPKEIKQALSFAIQAIKRVNNLKEG